MIRPACLTHLFLVVFMGIIITFHALITVAFPDTVRHGYLSCSTCHFSPSGRGILTPYGKTIANELYNHWKNTSSPPEGSLDEVPPWWQMGGQLRVLQLLQDSKSRQRARFFPMQTEIDGVINLESWTLVLTAGLWRPIESPNSATEFYFRNHYLTYKPSEEWLIRSGRFRINHGLGLSDHTLLVNQNLNWSHSDETNNLEVTHLNEESLWSATWITPSQLLVSTEVLTGGSIGFEKLIFRTNKIGFNLTSFKRNEIPERQFNFHSVLSLTEQLYLQFEFANRYLLINKIPSHQMAHWTRLSKEFFWGLRPFIQYEKAIETGLNSELASNIYLGTEWFPRAGMEFLLFGGKEYRKNKEEQQTLNLQGHFYF